MQVERDVFYLDEEVWCQVLGVDSVEDLWVEWQEEASEDQECWLIPIGGVLRVCADLSRLEGLGSFLRRWEWILRVLEGRVLCGVLELVDVEGVDSGGGAVADWPDWLVGMCLRTKEDVGMESLLGEGVLIMRVRWVRDFWAGVVDC